MTQTQTLTDLRHKQLATQEAQLPQIQMGFGSSQGFELMQRGAKLLAASSLVPKEFQGNIPNCTIALNMANRLGADPLLVMQNLYVVHGRPGWSSKFLIATFNQCGRFTSVRYEWKGAAGEKEWGCRAWATEKLTGERIEGAWITWKMVEAEGWNKRSGSKWLTIPDQMFMYRAAAWMINTHAPELSMGLSTAEEIGDVFDAHADSQGNYSVTVESLREAAASVEGEIVDHSTGEVVTQPHGDAGAGPQTNQQGMAWTYGDIQTALKTANARDELDEAASLIGALPNTIHRDQLNALYEQRAAELH